VSENKVLGRIFGPKRDEVMGEWRNLHNEELRNMYSSSGTIRTIKSRRMRCAGHVARMGRSGMHIDYWSEGKRPPGRPRHRWVANIKMDLEETGLGGVDWICLTEDRDKWRALMNVVLKLWAP
jgi:hypothetical protein